MLRDFTGKTYELADLIRAGIEAEAMGFDLVWVHDAPLGRRTTAAYDPVVILSHLAGATKQVMLASGILMPHVRNPVILAQQWATLHEASQGRAIMGVGTGAGAPTLLKREYEALAALRHDTTLDPQKIYDNRGRFFEETMEVIRRLWTEDKFSYAGEFIRFEEVTLGQARPAAPPPVLMGAGISFPLEAGSTGSPRLAGEVRRKVHLRSVQAHRRLRGRLARVAPHAGRIREEVDPRDSLCRRSEAGESSDQGIQLLRPRQRRPGFRTQCGEAAPGRFPWPADMGRRR